MKIATWGEKMVIGKKMMDMINQDIESFIEQYREVPVEKLASQFGVNTNAKNVLNPLVRKMLTSNGSPALSLLGNCDDIVIKTVRLDKYGQLKESMSFPVFKYCDLAKETWETSELRNLFFQKIFAFTVFKANGKDMYLSKIIIWEMPMDVLENGVKKAWERMHSCLTEGKIVKYLE